MGKQRKRPSDKRKLSASEQKLQAANQQLQATEQQLRAANQQLEASNQQLRASEEELRETHDYLDNLLDYANAPIIVWDPKFKITRFNRAFGRLTGYTADEVIGRKPNILFPRASRDESMRNIKCTLSGEYWESVEIPVLRKDGDIRIVLWNSANIYGEDGTTLLATIAQGQDITERKKVDAALRESRDYLEKLTNSMWDVVFSVKMPERVIEWANDSFRLTGYEPEECVGRTTEFLYPDKREFIDFGNKLRKAIKAGEDVLHAEQILRRKNGETFPAEITTTIFREKGEIRRVTSIVRDITEHKKAEEALRESEEKYRTQFEEALDAIFIADAETGVLIDCNRGACELVGRKKTELIGEHQRILHPIEEAEGEFSRTFKQHLKEKERQVLETKVITRNGEVKEVAIKANLFELQGKRFLQGIFRDITGRKRAEETLRAANQQLQASEQQLKAANRQLRANEQQLKAANRQLRANEQQLKAANQQLQANEQQLRAANQQLRANEQQLRAANEQLRASEQQLRAANQQLRANEQQLRAANQQLQASEQQLLDDQAQLKQLASELTLAEESERHRIATELHATIGQSLSISKLQLDALQASVPSGDIAKTVGEVCESLDETIQGTRSLTFDLSSPILYEVGFEKAVAEWLVDQIEEKHRIATEFEDDEQPKPLDDDIRVFLFRDVRELLINVVRHASASKVKVSIRKVGRQIEVSVEDDGWGFDSKKVAATAVRKGKFGLFSIRERLAQLGGKLEIESAPGQGTKVTVMAPLKRERINNRGPK